MRRIAVAVLEAMVLLPLTGCGGHSVLGCRLRSVDKGPYVAKNDAVLRRVPVYPGSYLVGSFSYGIPAPNACSGRENGPPYDHFYTRRTFSKPSGTARGKIIRFYRKTLAPEWRLVGYSVADPPIDSTFERDRALLYVSETDRYWVVEVDHAASRER